MNKKITFLSALILASASIVIANGDGPSGDFTGAPLLNGNAGSTCATSNCHDDNTNNSGNITLAVTEKGKLTPVTKYAAGKTYTVGVVVSGKLGSKYGFSATVLDPTRAKTGTTNGAAAGTKIMTHNSRSIAMHDAGSLLGVFAFDWTPPTSPSDSVTIYATGNVTDGKSTRTGDQVIAKSMKLYFDKTSNVSGNIKTGHIVYPNPAKDVIYFGAVCNQVMIYNLNGTLVLKSQHTDNVQISTLPTGVYFANLTLGNSTSIAKFVKN